MHACFFNCFIYENMVRYKAIGGDSVTKKMLQKLLTKDEKNAARTSECRKDSIIEKAGEPDGKRV